MTELTSTMNELKIGPLSSDSLEGLKVSAIRLGYVDVHAHLIHEKFENKEDFIAEECIRKGLDFVIVNGLEPVSNRKILEYCKKYHPFMQPAIGIYPLDAANRFIFTEEDSKSNPEIKANWMHEFPPPTKFNVDEEIEFIEEMCRQKVITAIGECGLDRHYLTDEISFQEQERVLRRLMQVN
jgi:TatD DNase family protein